MKKKTWTSRFFKVAIVLMATMFAMFAFAGCEKEERSSVESSETNTTMESTTQEEPPQESEIQETSITEYASQETTEQKSIIEVSWEESDESAAQSSEEESQPSEVERYTIEEIKKVLPVYDLEDGEKIHQLGRNDIVVYARYIDKSGQFRFKEGDIVGILGMDKYEECVFWLSANGDIGLIYIEYFEYLKDYVPKEGELAE